MSKKIYIVSPDGHIVEASRDQRDAAEKGQEISLKPGWRVASQADIDAAAKVEADRKKAEKPSVAPRGPLAK